MKMKCKEESREGSQDLLDMFCMKVWLKSMDSLLKVLCVCGVYVMREHMMQLHTVQTLILASCR